MKSRVFDRPQKPNHPSLHYKEKNHRLSQRDFHIKNPENNNTSVLLNPNVQEPTHRRNPSVDVGFKKDGGNEAAIDARFDDDRSNFSGKFSRNIHKERKKEGKKGKKRDSTRWNTFHFAKGASPLLVLLLLFWVGWRDPIPWRTGGGLLEEMGFKRRRYHDVLWLICCAPPNSLAPFAVNEDFVIIIFYFIIGNIIYIYIISKNSELILLYT